MILFSLPQSNEQIEITHIYILIPGRTEPFDITALQVGGVNESVVSDAQHTMRYRTVWEAISSCFGSGYWINDRPWINTEGWKNLP